MFPNLPKTNFNFSVTFISSSASAFNLDQSTNLSCGKELTPLPNDKIVDMTKLKAFADEKSNVAEMAISLFDRVENTVGKGEYADCQHFLLFLQCYRSFLLYGC